MFSETVNVFNVIIAIIFGIGFMIGLYFIYKVCMKFNSKSTIKTGVELIGEIATVHVPYLKNKYICILKDSREIVCSSELPLKTGSSVRINNYISGIYYVSQKLNY